MNEKQFDSYEEYLFAHWCEELKSEGYIRSWQHEGITIDLTSPKYVPWRKQMKTKVKVEEKKLLEGSSYTPDFTIKWERKANGVFCWQEMGTYNKIGKGWLFSTEGVSIVEIKPAFDRNNMTRLVRDRIKQAMEHGTFVNLIKVPDFFKFTFAPERFFYTPSGNALRKKKGEPLIHSPEWLMLPNYINKLQG